MQRRIEIRLPRWLAQALRAHMAARMNLLPAKDFELEWDAAHRAWRANSAVSASAGRYLAALLRAHLTDREQARRARASKLLEQYWPVVRAAAAKAFQRLRGAVPLDELVSAATEEAAKGALRFDPALGYSPAPFLRRWAEWGIHALLEARTAEAQLIHPDQELEACSRWERLGAVDSSLETAGERQELRAALRAFLRQQPPPQRCAVELLAQGEDDDLVAEATGLSLAEIGLLREALAAAVGVAPDAELTPVQAAQACGVQAKVVYKALSALALRGRKVGGAWVLRAADVRAWQRARAAT